MSAVTGDRTLGGLRQQKRILSRFRRQKKPELKVQVPGIRTWAYLFRGHYLTHSGYGEAKKKNWQRETDKKQINKIDSDRSARRRIKGVWEKLGAGASVNGLVGEGAGCGRIWGKCRGSRGQRSARALGQHPLGVLEELELCVAVSAGVQEWAGPTARSLGFVLSATGNHCRILTRGGPRSDLVVEHKVD